MPKLTAKMAQRPAACKNMTFEMSVETAAPEEGDPVAEPEAALVPEVAAELPAAVELAGADEVAAAELAAEEVFEPKIAELPLLNREEALPAGVLAGLEVVVCAFVATTRKAIMARTVKVWKRMFTIYERKR
jgi:hypothetical protein